jgi:hypothetical protein
MHPLRIHYDKWLLGAAGLLLATGLVWSRAESLKLKDSLASPLVRPTVQELPSMRAVVSPVATVPTWDAPAGSRNGQVRPADLFTPPSMQSPEQTMLADERREATSADLPGGPKLVAVEREPYRLQLNGYVGSPGAYTVAFVDAVSSETMLVRVGEPVPGLGLRLLAFDLAPVVVRENEAGPVLERIAVARLEDIATGERISLDTHGPRLTDKLRATIRLAEGDHGLWSGGEGDRFFTEARVHLLTRIRLDPTEVWLSTSVPDEPSRLHVLRLASSSAQPPAPPAGEESARVAVRQD